MNNIWIKKNIARFNFTWAIDGGAWLETKAFVTSDGPRSDREWFSFAMIENILGKGEFNRLRTKQGWMTGCWVDISAEGQVAL